MKKVKEKVWVLEDGKFFLTNYNRKIKTLDNAVYTVGLTPFGQFYLEKTAESFNFDYKVYGLETKLVNRVLKTYNSVDYGNLGILLNGLKGTGKTVTSKIIANKLNQPVIIVDAKIDNVHNFLNDIPQNITIFIDEYEKIFGDSSRMLTIMDGALNSAFRRVFLLTTNELYVDRNLIQRPSRIRYLKKFDNLSPEIVEEIIDDILIDKTFKQNCISFISNLETITVDIVKAVLNEVNIHNETPSEFESVFNVKRLRGKYNVKMLDENKEWVELASNVNIYPRPTFNEDNLNNYVSIDNTNIGTIKSIINWTTIEIEPLFGNKNKPVGFNSPIIVKVEDAEAVNYAFAYSDYGSSMVTKPTLKTSSLLKNVIAEIIKDEEEEYYDDNQTISLTANE